MVGDGGILATAGDRDDFGTTATTTERPSRASARPSARRALYTFSGDDGVAAARGPVRPPSAAQTIRRTMDGRTLVGTVGGEWKEAGAIRIGSLPDSRAASPMAVDHEWSCCFSISV